MPQEVVREGRGGPEGLPAFPSRPLEPIRGFSSVQVTAQHLHSSSEDEEAEAAFPSEVSLQQVALCGKASSVGPSVQWTSFFGHARAALVKRRSVAL